MAGFLDPNCRRLLSALGHLLDCIGAVDLLLAISPLVEIEFMRNTSFMRAELFLDDRTKEMEYARSLAGVFQRIDELSVRNASFEVKSGSELDRDDQLTPYDPLSHQVAFLLMFGFDYIDLLRRTITDHGMPVVGIFPLVRSAVESASEILWLTTGGTRSKRVFRTLHRVWHSVESGEPTLARVIPGRKTNKDEIHARLQELLARVKGNQKSLGVAYPSMTTIVSEASKNCAPKVLEPIAVWQLCSGMAHANSGIARTILETKEVGPSDTIGSTFRLATSYQLAVVLVEVVAGLLERSLYARDALNEKPNR